MVWNANIYFSYRQFRINIFRPRKEGRHFADGIFKYIFLNENQHISIKISQKFVDTGPFDKLQALV